jgi:hypothetical protein
MNRQRRERRKTPPVSTNRAATCNAVSNPSPVDKKSRKITCPDGSPPNTAPVLRMPCHTCLSPTAVTSERNPNASNARKRPKLLMTVTTTVFVFKRPWAFRCRAAANKTASPSRG